MHYHMTSCYQVMSYGDELPDDELPSDDEKSRIS